jgi:acetyl esterase/lipase
MGSGSDAAPLVEGTDVTATEAGGVKGEMIVAPGAEAHRVVLYFHGGGYVIGGSGNHRAYCSRLSAASGARVLAIDYRLAPEHPYPAAVEDAIAPYQGLLSSGLHPGNIAIAGDSAGGGLAIATLLNIKDYGLPMASCAVGISPWTDLSLSGASMMGRADMDPLVTPMALQWMANHYVSRDRAKEPLASPLFGDLTGIAPLLIQVGTHEVLYDDAVRIHEAAQQAGVTSTLESYDGQIHVFPILAPHLPESAQAVASAGAFIKAHAFGTN